MFIIPTKDGIVFSSHAVSISYTTNPADGTPSARVSHVGSPDSPEAVADFKKFHALMTEEWLEVNTTTEILFLNPDRIVGASDNGGKMRLSYLDANGSIAVADSDKDWNRLNQFALAQLISSRPIHDERTRDIYQGKTSGF